MLLFIIPLLADLFLWYALTSDLRKRNRAFRVTVLAVKATLTAALLYIIIRIAVYGGEFAEPASAYRQIVFGAVAALHIIAASVYIIMILVTWLPGRLLHRRLEGARTINIILFLLIVILFADGFYRQRFDVRTVRQDIAVKGLDPALHGMKIVLISDLHLSSWYRHYERLSKVMDLINAEKPDLLVNTGDFITFGWQEYGRCDTILRRATARSGAFAVIGNHDDGTYHPDYDAHYGAECREMLKHRIADSGYQLLSDTVMTTRVNGVEIAVAGVDTHGHHFDMRYGNFEKVMGEVPDSLFTVMLLHDPAGWLLTAIDGHMPQLTVSGHTHGMQLGIPGLQDSPAGRFHERWRGHYSIGDSHLYVTTGLGTMGMAVRLFMPPEIVVLTVTPE